MAATEGTKELVWPVLPTWPDRRSPPDLQWGRWRYLLNTWCPEPGKLNRMPGWRKYGWDMRVTDNSDLWSKADLSDIDSLYSHESPDGSRRLFAGSATCAYCQSGDGRWRTLADFKSGRPMSFASLGSTVFATNDVDIPQYHVIDEQVDADGQAFHEIPELTQIGLSAASIVVQWRGVVMLMNVVMDGARIGHRVVWSDVGSGLSWVPDTASIAGFQDLTPGTTICGALPLGDALYIFASGGAIWRASFVGGDTGFGFAEVHSSRDGVGCIRSRNALSAYTAYTGVKEIWYLANDGLWKIDQFSGTPMRPDWAWGTSPALGSISNDACQSVVMGTQAERQQLWVSYPSTGTTNNTTIVFNLQNEVACEVDHGFRAFLDHQQDTRELVYEWMERVLGCSSSDVDALFPLVREQARPVVAASTGLPCSDDGFFPKCSECRPNPMFLMISTSDGCIKQFDEEVYGREQRVNGTYRFDPYGMRWLSGCVNYGKVSTDKRLSRLHLDYIATPATEPASMRLSVWMGGTPADVLQAGCYAKEIRLSAKPVQCPSTTPAGSSASTKAPNSHLMWNFLVDARYHTIDLVMDPCLGGGFSASRLAVLAGESPVSTG